MKKKKDVSFVDTASRKEMSVTHCYRYRGKGDREKKTLLPIPVSILYEISVQIARLLSERVVVF
jgi:hypothetical protein